MSLPHDPTLYRQRAAADLPRPVRVDAPLEADDLESPVGSPAKFQPASPPRSLDDASLDISQIANRSVLAHMKVRVRSVEEWFVRRLAEVQACEAALTERFEAIAAMERRMREASDELDERLEKCLPVEDRVRALDHALDAAADERISRATQRVEELIQQVESRAAAVTQREAALEELAAKLEYAATAHLQRIHTAGAETQTNLQSQARRMTEETVAQLKRLHEIHESNVQQGLRDALSAMESRGAAAAEALQTLREGAAGSIDARRCDLESFAAQTSADLHRQRDELLLDLSDRLQTAAAPAIRAFAEQFEAMGQTAQQRVDELDARAAALDERHRVADEAMATMKIDLETSGRAIVDRLSEEARLTAATIATVLARRAHEATADASRRLSELREAIERCGQAQHEAKALAETFAQEVRQHMDAAAENAARSLETRAAAIEADALDRLRQRTETHSAAFDELARNARAAVESASSSLQELHTRLREESQRELRERVARSSRLTASLDAHCAGRLDQLAQEAARAIVPALTELEAKICDGERRAADYTGRVQAAADSLREVSESASAHALEAADELRGTIERQVEAARTETQACAADLSRMIDQARESAQGELVTIQAALERRRETIEHTTREMEQRSASAAADAKRAAEVLARRFERTAMRGEAIVRRQLEEARQAFAQAIHDADAAVAPIRAGINDLEARVEQSAQELARRMEQAEQEARRHAETAVRQFEHELGSRIEQHTRRAQLGFDQAREAFEERAQAVKAQSAAAFEATLAQCEQARRSAEHAITATQGDLARQVEAGGKAQHDRMEKVAAAIESRIDSIMASAQLRIETLRQEILDPIDQADPSQGLDMAGQGLWDTPAHAPSPAEASIPPQETQPPGEPPEAPSAAEEIYLPALRRLRNAPTGSRAHQEGTAHGATPREV